jgi:hypothetical protein
MSTNAVALPFRTADYGQVGYLFALGFTHEQLERDGSQIYFHFAASPKLLAALGDYGSNAPVPCRDFFHALRKAKAIIQEHMYGSQRSHTSV